MLSGYVIVCLSWRCLGTEKVDSQNSKKMIQEKEELSGVSVSKSRKKTSYTPEFRRQKVCEYFRSGMGIAAFSRQTGVPVMTLHGWVSAFKEAQPAIVDSAMTKDEKTRALEEEVAKLKRELVKATLERDKARACAHAWETMVDVAEEMFGIAIRKKPAPNNK